VPDGPWATLELVSLLKFSIRNEGNPVVTKVTPEFIDTASTKAIQGAPPVLRTPVPQVSKVGAMMLIVKP
jgi:hypothetical protein